jgi:hypothetical protein
LNKYFLDTEFIENGKTIDLISIGIVSEGGDTYYAVNDSCEFFRASEWVMENVIKPHVGCYERRETGSKVFEYYLNAQKSVKSREQIVQDILDFIPPESNPEFWGYYADYDWIVFCQLFGTMMDLPDGYPMYCRDLKQEIDSIEKDYLLKIELPPQAEDLNHHALSDACWEKDCYTLVNESTRIERGKDDLVSNVREHPNYIEPHYLLQFFKFAHLPEALQSISRPFCQLAEAIDQSSADGNPEKGMALRKLLEAKDCAVRAAIFDSL